MILHIPHSADKIPEHLRDQIVLSDDELTAELLRMTDRYTDELFAFPEVTIVRFPISRLFVDVERFHDNTREPMSKVGMGVIYTHTADGKKLRRSLQSAEKRTLFEFYEKHHEMISKEVKTELDKYGKALIVDCHSFPSHPLPCDNNQTTPRPDFCIGTDSFHTPLELRRIVEGILKKMGYSVGIDQPYNGTMVPMEFCGKDLRVESIMIEVNRSLYMDEITGRKKDTFVAIKEQINTFLRSIIKYQQPTPPGF